MIPKIYFHLFPFLSLFFLFSSCLSTKEAVSLLQKNKSYYQQGDFSSLSLLSPKNLLKANDNKQGTLYYGGLLLFFNKKKNLSEIALRRASRTGQNPWAQESARIVTYIMASDARYNQIIPFIESIYSKKVIVTDAELFHYYSLSLFLSEQYETLSKLLEMAKTYPLQKDTLRNRITIAQGKFSKDLWSTLLAIQKKPSNIKKNNALIFSLFSTHRAKNMIGNIVALIEKIYTIENIDASTKALLNAKLAIKNNPQEAFTKMLTLNPSVFIHPATVQDILEIQRNTNKTLELLIKARKDATEQQNIMLNIAIAQLYFLKRSFRKSYALYARALKSPLLTHNSFIDPSALKKVQWRMIFSLIQKGASSQEFIKEFKDIIKQTKTHSFFANLLEEYLSYLLQKKSYKRIQEDFSILSTMFNNVYIVAELNRWKSILKRINKNSSSLTTQTNNFIKSKNYYSDSSFDYLVNNQNISKKDFLNTWTQPQSESSVNQKQLTIERFIPGYFDFGLYNYAIEILGENINSISTKTAVYASTILNTRGKYIDSLSIIRKKSTMSEIPQNEQEFFLLYPKIHTKYINNVIQNKKQEALIYALIREESNFNPTVISAAGAKGLFQLLPSTAKDIAERIKYKNTFDLFSVEDNILLGYSYLKYLVKVVHSPITALVAYNGGLGNLWKWQEKFDTSNFILFADSIPFRETRNYIRKVASSAIIYALLYYDIPPKTMIQYLIKEEF